MTSLHEPCRQRCDQAEESLTETKSHIEHEPAGLVFDIQKFSIHDGPGIRTTVFLKGCQIACLWCHNPESQMLRTEVTYNASRCIYCERCLAACTVHAINVKPGTKLKTIDRDYCTGCGDCVEACPSVAMERIGRYMTVAEVVGEVAKDEVFYRRSGGGVTISGGEPLVQADFALALASSCKAQGFHVAIDTNGHVNWLVLEKAASIADLILYDIKHIDSDKHRALTGVGSELILENLQNLAKQPVEVWGRYPVIPGCNDSEPDIRQMAEFVVSLKTIKRIDLLPFHRLGEAKYEKLGKKYWLSNTAAPAAELMDKLKRIVTSYGFQSG